MTAALASALLYAASFPPLSLSWLAWIALVPVLAAMARQGPARASLYGLAFGTFAAIGVTWFFPEMVTSFFDAPAAVGWLALAAAALVFGGLTCAAFGAWLGWVAARGRAGPIVVAAGWGACELARARLGIGNPWALLGYSQVGHPLLVQIADVTGPYGPGMLVAAVNAVVASSFAPPLRGRRPIVGAGLVALMVIATIAYGGLRLQQSFGVGPPFEVAAVQLGRSRAAAAPEAERVADVARYAALTRDLTPAPAIVVWPEHALPFFLQDVPAAAEPVLAVTRGTGSELIVGGPYYVLGATEARQRNSIFLVRNGRVAGRYDKRLLLPIAEDDAWPARAALASPYVAGDQVHSLRSAEGLVGSFLCFEAMYPEVVRRFVTSGAALLANPSNDSWFRRESAARHQLDIASLRAIESRRWLVRAATGGFSAIVDPHGRLVEVAGFGVPAVVRAPVQRSRTRTPYDRIGDAAAWLAVGVAAAAALAPRRRG